MKLSSVVLASSSPQKKRLMLSVANELSLDLIIESPDVEEIVDENPEKTAIANAILKLREVEGNFVVSSDAFAFCEGKKLFKPKDKEEARKMLEFISGKEVLVYTATSVRIMGWELTDLTISTLLMKEFSSSYIEQRISNPEILKKAGAFSISDVFVIKKGNIESVMGLNTNFVISMYNAHVRDLEHI